MGYLFAPFEPFLRLYWEDDIIDFLWGHLHGDFRLFLFLTFTFFKHFAFRLLSHVDWMLLDILIALRVMLCWTNPSLELLGMDNIHFTGLFDARLHGLVLAEFRPGRRDHRVVHLTVFSAKNILWRIDSINRSMLIIGGLLIALLLLHSEFACLNPGCRYNVVRYLRVLHFIDWILFAGDRAINQKLRFVFANFLALSLALLVEGVGGNFGVFGQGVIVFFVTVVIEVRLLGSTHTYSK